MKMCNTERQKGEVDEAPCNSAYDASVVCFKASPDASLELDPFAAYFMAKIELNRRKDILILGLS